VRFLLDAHVSGPRTGNRLQVAGHDVRALDQERGLEGLDDEDVLVLACQDERILVTFDIADFPNILREWSAAQRSHPGVILVYGMNHGEFDLVVRGIKRWVDLHPEPESWTDLAAVVGRGFASG
jgi:predicted nuclease of predicted toxin-antitoxin system